MSDSNYSALIVDFGGVMTTSIFDSFRAFCDEHGVHPKKLMEVLVAKRNEDGVPDPDHPTHRIERGHMSGDEFNAHLAERLSTDLAKPLEPTGLKDRLFAYVRPEPEVVNAITKLRAAGIATGLLSNSWGGDGYPRESFAELFDAVVISGEVGMRKPEPEIYQMTAKLLGKPVNECVFVDDLSVNVEGAERVGMAAILHTDPLETVEKLKTLFAVDL